MKQKQNRRQRREHIAPFIIHSKALDENSVNMEEVLPDGSIKFYVRGFASTTAKDGSGDIVVPDGVKLDRYLVNPIIKIGHKRGEENNIGLTKQINVLPDGIYIEAEIILNNTIEMHKSIIHGLRHGLIKGFSIGFRDLELEFDEEKDATIIKSLELYEISLVDIPDNPLTVMKALDLMIQKHAENSEKTGNVHIEETKCGGDEEECSEEETHHKEVEEVKSPACRMEGESKGDCLERKIKEITEENPDMDDDQVVAVATSMCEKSCEDKSLSINNETMETKEMETTEQVEETTVESTETKEEDTVEATEATEETTEITEEATEETTESEESEEDTTETSEETTDETTEEKEEEKSTDNVKTKEMGTEDTSPENGGTESEQDSDVQEKSLGMKHYQKALEEHEGAILALTDMVKALSERNNKLEETVAKAFSRLKSTIIDGPLQYQEAPTQAKTFDSPIARAVRDIERSM